METFSSYMERVLYDRERGYYLKKEHPASNRDYITASSHPLLSGAIEKFIRKNFKFFKIDFLDIGAGDGKFLINLKKRFKGERIRFIAIEKIKRFEEEDILFFDTLEKIDEIEGIIFSFELFDSLPFHIIEKKDNVVRELYVEKNQFVLSDLSCQEISNYLKKYQIELSDGQRAEVCLQAEVLYKELSRKLKKGFILTFDYGFKASILYKYGFFPAGTLMTHKNKEMDRNPLEKPYEKDITCAVNFSALELSGEELGLKTLGFLTLSKFLVENLGEELKEIREFVHPIPLYDLIFGKVGQDIKVLIQEKN